MSTMHCGCDPDAKYVAPDCWKHVAYVENGITPITEVRVTDPITGGQKGSKLARFSLIPQDWLWALAEHYGKGALKYDDNNWKRGYSWSLTLDAHSRHLAQWLGGEDDDRETGSSHLVAAAWHLVALWWFHKHGKGTDDIRTSSSQ